MGIKSNAEILKEFLPQIEKGCYSITKGGGLTKELIQEVCLQVMKLDNKKLNRLYPNECYKYFNGIANTLYWKDPVFDKKFRDKNADLDVNIELVEDNFNQYEYLAELDLDPNESLWVRTYLRFEGNFTWIANSTGISRQHCSKRIKYISKKHKKK